MMKRILSLVVLCGAVSLVSAEEVVESKGMTVYGQHELPKVLYVVPWKRKDAPELEAPQSGSLATDVLTPIEPDIFKRQASYYELMARKLEQQ